MGLSERVAEEHKVLVDCLEAITEHSGRTVLQMGSRLGDVMTQGLQLRNLMQEVAAAVGTTHTADLAADLHERGEGFRSIASRATETELESACNHLADTLDNEVTRLIHNDRRRQAEVLTLTSELGALTGTLLTQTGQAISALQFQDPAVQELRRIDSLVVDLRKAIDDNAEALKWGRRVGDAQTTQPKTPEALASRALAIREDTRRRVEVFETDTRQAVDEVRRIHHHLRAVTHAQVAKSKQAADTLNPDAPDAKVLQHYCASFGAALSQLEAMMETGGQVAGNLSRILEISEHAIDEGYGRRSNIAVAADAVANRIDSSTDHEPEANVLGETRDQLQSSQETLAKLVDHDKRVRSLALRVEGQLEATRNAFASFERPIQGEGADPVPGLLVQASDASDRLFRVICEEFQLDATKVEPEASWQEAVAEDAGAEDGLILL